MPASAGALQLNNCHLHIVIEVHAILGRILTRTLACKSWETALTYDVKARCLQLQVPCGAIHHILLIFTLAHACNTQERFFKRTVDQNTGQSAPT